MHYSLGKNLSFIQDLYYIGYSFRPYFWSLVIIQYDLVASLCIQNVGFFLTKETVLFANHNYLLKSCDVAKMLYSVLLI